MPIRKINNPKNKLTLVKSVYPEQAGMILPQSMYIEFIETASLAGYARLVQLCTTPGAQREIRDYAKVLGSLVAPCFPVAWKVLEQVGKEQEPSVITTKEQTSTVLP